MRSLLRDQPGWKGIGYGLIKLPLGIINFTSVVTMWSVALGGTTFPLWGWLVPSKFGDNHPIHGWLKVGYIAANFVVGVLLLIATPHVIRGLAAMDRGSDQGFARWIADSRAAPTRRDPDGQPRCFGRHRRDRTPADRA